MLMASLGVTDTLSDIDPPCADDELEGKLRDSLGLVSTMRAIRELEAAVASGWTPIREHPGTNRAGLDFDILICFIPARGKWPRRVWIEVPMDWEQEGEY